MHEVYRTKSAGRLLVVLFWLGPGISHGSKNRLGTDAASFSLIHLSLRTNGLEHDDDDDDDGDDDGGDVAFTRAAFVAPLPNANRVLSLVYC